MRRPEWPLYYILIDRTPVAVDAKTWANFFESIENRRVAEDQIGNARVSTVFLGLDHNFGSGDPLLFESMVFGGPLDKEMWRYHTYAEAERGHAEAVTAVRKAAAKIKSIADNAGAK